MVYVGKQNVQDAIKEGEALSLNIEELAAELQHLRRTLASTNKNNPSSEHQLFLNQMDDTEERTSAALDEFSAALLKLYDDNE